MQTEPTNVIDIKSQKPLLPFQVRSILKTQYLISADSKDSGDDFVKKLEERLVAEAAMTVVRSFKEWANTLSQKG